uniref:U3 small nucleolar RNA-associated protein 11 n=1 Tax=Lepeophtheirus salmonis TaxID=72036 RepID=D3PGL9_LEPSM|nr:Probable U3 small nucleolar RNA-associated protein 11 [Lepeophtheirus salmonis]
MSSSLKKASKLQKTHRERHQPESRKNFGLLEKKKDYKIRAKDYNEKKVILKKLRQKALDKNPDEFYHHMINSELVDDVHEERLKNEKEEFTPEQIAVMQSQDIKYVIHRRSVESKKIEKLKSSLHLISTSGVSKNMHTFFVDEEREKKRFDVAKRLDTHPDLLDRSHNRPTNSTLDTVIISTPSRASDLLKERRYKELDSRIKRERQLGIIEDKMRSKMLLKNKKDKPQKMVVTGSKTSAPIYKWAQERKR